MGQRANLLILKDNTYELYYDHWCANTLPQDLFWGPTHAIKFIQAQERVESDDWLDNVWAEGGAVIDTDRNVFLLFGGEDILYDVPLRKMYLRLIQSPWRGWDIQWAHRGIVDLARYVGYPEEKVIDEADIKGGEMRWEPPEDIESINIVGSIKFKDQGCLLFPLFGEVELIIENGPAILDNVVQEYGHPRVDLNTYTKEFPTGGFHIDVQRRELRFWQASGVYDLESIRKQWFGWTVYWFKDEYEKQVEWTDRNIVFPLKTDKQLVNELQSILMQETMNPVHSILELANVMAAEGKDTEINSSTLSHQHISLPIQKRREILEKAVCEISGLAYPGTGDLKSKWWGRLLRREK
ncbi:MAG: hypothetical protein ACM3MK_03725 [Chitinophagales bacterium]